MKNQARERLQCDWCSYKSKVGRVRYEASVLLFRHYLFSHSDLMVDGKLVCDQCDYETFFNGHLNRHMERKHSEQQKPTLVCDDCSKSYTDMFGLWPHFESIHHQRDAYDCGQCGGTFNSKVQLMRHTSSRHARKLFCENCHYWCRQKLRLAGHIFVRHTPKYSTHPARIIAPLPSVL